MIAYTHGAHMGTWCIFLWSICKLGDKLEISHELNPPIRSNIYVCCIVRNGNKENTYACYKCVSLVVRILCMHVVDRFQKKKSMHACLFKMWCIKKKIDVFKFILIHNCIKKKIENITSYKIYTKTSYIDN